VTTEAVKFQLDVAPASGDAAGSDAFARALRGSLAAALGAPRGAVFLADQSGVVERRFGDKLLYIFSKIDGNADNMQSLGAVLGGHAVQQRNLPLAGAAPGGPEVHHDRFTLPVAHGHRFPFQVF
jgi:hypothetical protein